MFAPPFRGFPPAIDGYGPVDPYSGQCRIPAAEQIERDFDRDRYMSAEEAKEYGIVDNVIAHHEQIIGAVGAVAAVGSVGSVAAVGAGAK